MSGFHTTVFHIDWHRYCDYVGWHYALLNVHGDRIKLWTQQRTELKQVACQHTSSVNTCASKRSTEALFTQLLLSQPVLEIEVGIPSSHKQTHKGETTIINSLHAHVNRRKRGVTCVCSCLFVSQSRHHYRLQTPIKNERMKTTFQVLPSVFRTYKATTNRSSTAVHRCMSSFTSLEKTLKI